jgi:hypothetical protein
MRAEVVSMSTSHEVVVSVAGAPDVFFGSANTGRERTIRPESVKLMWTRTTYDGGEVKFSNHVITGPRVLKSGELSAVTSVACGSKAPEWLREIIQEHWPYGLKHLA